MATSTRTSDSSDASPPPSTQATPAVERSATFVTTHWTAVVTAGGADSPHAQAALEKLCQTYWYPLYAYIRRTGHPPEDAKDLTQAFFARLLEHNLIAKADRERGRFRSFLLASLKHFLAHEWEKSRALKRGGAAKLIPLQFDTAETRFAQPVATEDTPDRAFDRQWALALLDAVLGRLHREYSESGKERLFGGLKDTLSGARSEIPYRDLAGQLAMSEGAVNVEAELRHLFAALS
jgi:RNA polymerase sigma factor (sigma-70 family)